MDKKSTNTTGAASADSVQPVSSEPNTAVAQPVATIKTDEVAAVETIPATDASTGAPVDTVVIVKPPKKKKTGLIVGIIIATLLILGGIGFAIWYLAVYQNPENVVFDAMSNFFSAKHVQTEGELTYQIYDEEEDAYFAYKLKLENKSKTLPNATHVNLSMSEVDQNGSVVEDHTLDIDLGTAIMSDGVLYLQISNLTDTVEELATEHSVFEDEAGAAFLEIIELVDGEWWRISIPEIIDQLQLDNARPVKNLYSCIIDAAQQDRADEIAVLYRQHPFLDVEQDPTGHNTNGTTQYITSLDYDHLAAFLNGLSHTSASEDVVACYNVYAEATDGDAISLGDTKEISADDLRKNAPEGLTPGLNITDFGHELTEIMLFSGDEDAYFKGYLSFTYEPAEVTAPSEYRPITELVEEIAEVFAELFAGSEEIPDLPELPDFTLPVEIGV